MKIAPDTNVLVRAITADDPSQTQAAQHALQHADLVAVTLPALCELGLKPIKGLDESTHH